MKVDDEILLKIENARADGIKTSSAMAKVLKWSYTTYQNYLYDLTDKAKRENSKERILKALERGKERSTEYALSEAEQGLTKSARGGFVTEIKKEYKTDRDGKIISEILIKEHLKYIPPNVTAQIFLAINTAPDRWQPTNRPEPIEKRDKEVTSYGFTHTIIHSTKEEMIKAKESKTSEKI
ncbi:MAG: hypothetical protein GY853_14320 [PVC group bacterium]|nr:hypothetical protein [PVC group bacterium]